MNDTLFWLLDVAGLALVLTSAVGVVLLRNLVSAVLALSAMGAGLGLLFVLLAAPDDAHAEIVVGTIAMPFLYLVAIGKARTVVDEEGTDEAEE